MVPGRTQLGEGCSDSVIQKLLATWRSDSLLRQVAKNSGYLFSSSSLGIIFNLIASIYATRAVGVTGFAILGAITTFAAVADKLLSFRIGELVIKYAGGALAKNETRRAAAVFKTAALTELAVSLLSYLLIVALAPLAALYFAKDAALAPYFIFYGLIVPAGFIYESASALLQISGHFRSQAALNLAQSVVTALIVVYAYLSGAGLGMVLVAYLTGKIIIGFGYAALALWRAGQVFGPGWWRVPFRELPPAREFWGFALSSNFSGTVNLFVRDSDILWINALAGLEQGGYYKLAMSLIGYMLIPVDPFIKTSFPEIAKAVAEGAWLRLKNLLRRLTFISGATTLAFGLALVLFAKPLIFNIIYEPKFLPALLPALILFLGYGLANTLFWNRPLILALGHPLFPLVVTSLVGLGKIALSLALVPRFGMTAQAALMSAYLILSVGIVAARGVAEVQQSSFPTPNRSPL
ncbi:MAG: hypothetical protein CO094_12625 [Anaerolineae bacterium CG_4_9_14_3_um_filter_57_17]|nr:MAG: hypothetical protein CO094_12625 [Anaerolineae bacterium CG_4_9_14_3_um_filter_57_17]